MAGSVNKTIVVGCVGTKGFELCYAPTGTASASFDLACAEVWGDEKVHTTYIPCEVRGKKAEAVADIAPGTPVILDGKVMRRKVNDRWETLIACWDLVPLGVPTVPVTAPVSEGVV
jgi:single-stranded DNA-binding protein